MNSNTPHHDQYISQQIIRNKKIPNNEWFALNPEVSDNRATHAMVSHGQVILRLRPYEAYAYSRDEDGNNPRIIPETKHIITPLAMVGHFGSSASTAWSTDDNSRQWPGHSLEDATASMIAAADRLDGERGDRRVSRETLLKWIKPDDMVVDCTPVKASESNNLTSITPIKSLCQTT